MRLTDPLATALLAPSAALELRVPVVWADRVSAVRAQVGVHNAHGLPLFLGAQVLKDRPWKFTAYLMLYNSQLRRLDVNSSHRNRTGSRELWVNSTHKHTFSEQHHNSEAYTPTDIPIIPLSGVTGEHYREVFEAFCKECGVKLVGAYRWVHPVLGDSPLELDEEV